jgi:hypothetical protein
MSGSMALVAGPKESEQNVDIREMAIFLTNDTTTRAY